jgi:hypothetical protein
LRNLYRRRLRFGAGILSDDVVGFRKPRNGKVGGKNNITPLRLCLMLPTLGFIVAFVDHVDLVRNLA